MFCEDHVDWNIPWNTQIKEDNNKIIITIIIITITIIKTLTMIPLVCYSFFTFYYC